MLPEKIVKFFWRQHFTLVSTIDQSGLPHNSCKGLVEINSKGRVYLLDLYKERTFRNLKLNPKISVTGVDEHRFMGYCLKGTAKIKPRNKLSSRILKAWDKRIAGRITQRLLKEMRGEKGHRLNPEVFLPKPAYLIEVTVEEIIDLTPRNITKGAQNETKRK